MELDNEMDIDFAQYISDDEDYEVDLTSDLEEEEETDIYHGLSLVLVDGDEHFEELSDLTMSLKRSRLIQQGKSQLKSSHHQQLLSLRFRQLLNLRS